MGRDLPPAGGPGGGDSMQSDKREKPMIKHLSLTLAVTLGMAVAQGAAAAEYKGPGFAGDAYFAEDGKPLEKMGNVYVGRTGLRIDMKVEGTSYSSLISWDSATVVSLMHDQKMYMELPPEQSGWQVYEDKPCNGYTDGKKLGTETLNGRKVEKWRCTGPTNTVAEDTPVDATVWYDRELKIPTKTLEDDGNIFEIRDIKIGRQDASRFKIPDGYKKFEMNAMMQQMMQQQQQQQ